MMGTNSSSSSPVLSFNLMVLLIGHYFTDAFVPLSPSTVLLRKTQNGVTTTTPVPVVVHSMADKTNDTPPPPSFIDVALLLDDNDDDDDETPDPPPTMWKSRVGLFRMVRPSSIPGICLFHMTGVYLALQHHVATATARLSSSSMIIPDVNYWTVLCKEPLLWMTLLSVNLVSASSMVINDYYDAKLGRDQQQSKEEQAKNNSKVLQLDGSASSNNKNTVSLPTARRFLMVLYSVALLISTVLPGVTTRLAVVGSLMLTYLYTKYLKPRTWIKNISCATIIAFAPLASGLATLNLPRILESTTTRTTTSALCVPSLWRLFGSLFFGLLAREIYMDCNDMEADAASGVQTVPVVHGKQFAVRVAALSNLAMSCCCCFFSPIIVLRRSSSSIVRLCLATAVTGNQLRRSLQIMRNPNKRDLVQATVDEGLVMVAFLLATFI